MRTVSATEIKIILENICRQYKMERMSLFSKMGKKLHVLYLTTAAFLTSRMP